VEEKPDGPDHARDTPELWTAVNCRLPPAQTGVFDCIDTNVKEEPTFTDVLVVRAPQPPVVIVSV
jgi:hypothetical protein